MKYAAVPPLQLCSMMQLLQMRLALLVKKNQRMYGAVPDTKPCTALPAVTSCPSTPPAPSRAACGCSSPANPLGNARSDAHRRHLRSRHIQRVHRAQSTAKRAGVL